jgi:hypothetical protein
VALQDWLPAERLVGDGRELDAGSLLQLHVLCSDRPGLGAQVIGQLGQELEQRLGRPLAEIRPSVWYVRTDLADGRLAVSRITVRLGVSDPDEVQTLSEQLDDVEVSLRRALRTAPPEGASPLPATHAGWWDAPAVVSLRLVHAPAEPGSERPSGAEPGSGDETIDLTDVDDPALRELEN